MDIAPAFRSLPTPAGLVRLPATPADIGPFAAAMVRRYGPDGSIWARHPDVRAADPGMAGLERA